VIMYIHVTKNGLQTFVTGISYLPLYVQRWTEQSPARYRVLPVLPGLSPNTDTTLTEYDEERMSAIWDDLRGLLYRPDERIRPLDLRDLGL
jgi:hypothetical protein